MPGGSGDGSAISAAVLSPARSRSKSCRAFSDRPRPARPTISLPTPDGCQGEGTTRPRARPVLHRRRSRSLPEEVGRICGPPIRIERCQPVLITQRSQVQILPRYQVSEGQRPDRRERRSGLLVVCPRLVRGILADDRGRTCEKMAPIGISFGRRAELPAW